MSEPMTKDKLRQIAEWVEIIAYNEMSDPSSKFLVEAFEEIVRLRERERDLESAIDVADRYGGIDGDHHKTWVIDQMVRILTGENYDTWVKCYRDGEDGPETYDWDTGIAP